MNTLYLTYDGLTDPLGQSQILPYVIGLAKKGWNMTIISFEKKERFKSSSNEIQSICDQHLIIWIPLFYTKKPSVISTLSDLIKMKSIVSEYSKKEKVSLIHCRSYLPMLIALPFQKERIKVLFDMRGFWPDERVDGKIWKLNNPIYKSIYKFFKKKEKQFVQNADAIVSLTEAAIPKLEELGAQKDVTIIPTSTDLALFNPDKLNEEEIKNWNRKLNIEDKFVLGYSGSLGTWYLMDEMLLFFKKLKSEKSNAHFLIVTKDSNEDLVKKVVDLGLSFDDISIISGEREEMPNLYSLFDLSIMFIKASFSKKASSPTKLGELMAMGVPVICNSGVGDVDTIVKRYKAGLIIDDFTPNVIGNAISKIKEKHFYDKDLMKTGAQEYYNLNRGIDSYHNTYRTLIN